MIIFTTLAIITELGGNVNFSVLLIGNADVNMFLVNTSSAVLPFHKEKISIFHDNITIICR